MNKCCHAAEGSFKIGGGTPVSETLVKKKPKESRVQNYYDYCAVHLQMTLKEEKKTNDCAVGFQVASILKATI